MIYTKKDIDTAAQFILNQTGTAKCIAFTSGMGTGKTTLIGAICKQLGVKENTGSPTFSLINVYVTQNASEIFHLDLYRLKDMEEAMQSGVEEAVYSGSYCFIEWPHLILDILPTDTVFIDIRVINEEDREIVFDNSFPANQ